MKAKLSQSNNKTNESQQIKRDCTFNKKEHTIQFKKQQRYQEISKKYENSPKPAERHQRYGENVKI